MKKSTIKKLTALLLVLVMLLCLAPVEALALRCKHNNGTRWYEKPDGTGHWQVCNECGARLKTEDHDVFDDSKWDWTYYDVDSLGGEPGEHAQICKKCGYTRWHHHSYSSQTWNLNGKAHPNVMVCVTPGCNHVKEFSGNGYARYHLYYTSYVNFDYHMTTCAYCGYTSSGHKPTQKDYEKHHWRQFRNASQHWVECDGCHATYDKAGHNYETYVDEHQGWAYEKTTYCTVCGWVKSIKYTKERNEEGKWINIKELLNGQQEVIEYNSGTVDVHYMDKPGGTKPDPCKHPIKAYDESEEENRYYTFIGGKHAVHCGSCGEVLSTQNCSYEVETYERVRRQYIEDRPWIFEDPELGPDYVNNLYMEDYFKSGHYKVCKTCGGREIVAHNWDSSNGSNASADSCVRTCKDCGFTMRYSARLKDKDPSPHTYLTYQDNYNIDANMNIIAPDDGCCSYTNSGSSHRAKCEVCGYEHTERCDRDGWMELPGQPGKHLEFCSKCGGGKRVVDCGHKYVGAENSPAGFHAVQCPTCGDVYIPKTPCEFVLDEKNTDEFHHTYKCSYCGFEWHDNHIRRTIKTNVKPATATKEGSYDLLTYCEICNREITRSTIKIPKKDNPTALANVEGRYLFETHNSANMGTGSSFLNGTVIMDGVAEYLANNSAALLRGATFDPSHSFYKDGKQINANNTTRIVLYATAVMNVTDYTQDEDDVDEDDDRDEYTSMTATVTFTYGAHYVTTLNGVDYRDDTPVRDGNGISLYNLPLDLSGTPITMTLPLLTGLISNQTMFVRQTTDGGASYTTYLGAHHADWGLSNVTFTTENGFAGEFLFLPTEHWIEHVPRREPTDMSDGNIEYWYDKALDKYYSDILCEHEIMKEQTYINSNTYTVSFASGGGSGTAPAAITGVHKRQDVRLPECTFTNPGYEFYGWSSGDWVYRAGDLYTVTGDATLTAKWRLPGDTMRRVTFHPNADDAEGEMDEQICAPGDTIKLQANAFTREGWHFYGWSSNGEFRIPPYAFDQGTVYVDTDLDLYALWQPIYYITFDPNGDDVEGEMEPQAFPATPLLGSSESEWYVAYQRLVPNVYTRDGYVFKGWSLNPDGSGDTYQDGGVPPMDTTNPDNYTLYAIWEQTRFTVTFDKNADDAVGSMESMLFEKDIWDVIPQFGFERDGYVFLEWRTNPDGTGAKRTTGQLSSFSADTTLYAIWKRAWKITFDSNGAEDTMEPLIAVDGNYEYLPYNAIVRDGYKFDSWNTEPDGSGTKYYDHALKQWDSDLTLYAQWVKTRFTITYDANGGEGETGPQIVDFGAGYSSVCPRCSGSYKLTVTGPDLAVHFCDCCGFAVVAKDDGATTGLAVRSYASLVDYTINAKFDDIASLCAALIALYPDKDSTVVSGEETDEYAAYLALYNKAAEVMNASLSEVTKDTGYTFGSSAVIGVTDRFVLTPGANEYTIDETLGAVARLFGCSDTASFLANAQAAAAAYIANEAGADAASSSNRLKYEGAVFTSNGSFVLPYAFRCEASDTTLLAYVIIDAEGSIFIWISDLYNLYAASLYGLTLPDGIDAELEVYGRCSLFEAPRPLLNSFERDWYVFYRWNTAPDGSGTTYYANSTFSSYSLKEDITLYAQWNPNFCTVTFDANGGEGEMEPQVVGKNVPTALNACAFSREGYFFDGWSTSSTSSSASVHDGDEVTRSYDTKYYAVWKKIYTFTFDANGGYGVMEPQDVIEKTMSYLNKNTFMHDTLAFDYWSFTPDGVRAYSDGSSLYLSSAPQGTTLYAIWKQKTNVSSIVNFESVEAVYNGETPVMEATVEFASPYYAGSNGAITYVYYSGTSVIAENMLSAPPTDVGVYTVRAVYEDSRNKGYKDARLTIAKADRGLTPAATFLLLYGKDKSMALKVNDADGSARVEDVATVIDDESIVSLRADGSYKSGSILLVAVAYNGAGYTNVTFSLPETANYKADSATITVISKNGYDVYVDSVEGGAVTVNKPMAPEGSEVEVAATAKIGWTLDRITVTDDITNEAVEAVGGRFTMPECNVTVGAEFTQNEYTIAYADVDGVVYADGLPAYAHYGDVVTLAAAVGGNKTVKAFRCTYGNPAVTVTVTPDKYGVFALNMPAQNVIVTAVVGELYNVITENADGGSVDVSLRCAAEGATVNVIPNASEGYSVGALTYTANGVTKPVTVTMGESGEKTYSIIMPAADITVSAEFILNETLNDAIGHVDGVASGEQGRNEAEIGVTVDDETAGMLQNAVDAVDVNLTVGEGGRSVGDEEKASAVEALAQAGFVSVEGEGDNVAVVNTGDNSAAEIRIVDKTYVEITVKEFAEADGNIVMTLEITPMVQTVATSAPEGTVLDSENSVPLSEARAVDVAEMTKVTVGIPKAMAIAAGGAGSVIYIQHTHDGKTYEYPAVISGNDEDGYTASFDNPNGYSEFTLSVQTNTVASFEFGGSNYCFTSFAEAIAEALAKDVTLITMHKMPSGEDYATVTKTAELIFEAAEGCGDAIDFDALYANRILTDVGIAKTSAAEQLAQHVFVFTDYEKEVLYGDLDGDGEITVADALAALRIAVKLAEETEDAIFIGDVDGDGKITVSDALRILRVAAKLATPGSLG